MASERNVEDELLERCIPEPNTGCWFWEDDAAENAGVSKQLGSFIRAEANRARSCGFSSCCNPAHLSGRRLG